MSLRLAYLAVLHVFGWLALLGRSRRPVTRQARTLLMNLEDHAECLKSLTRDRDATFTVAFDAVLTATRLRIITTPLRAPRANAIAERWAGSARRGCPDRIPIASERHLRLVLSDHVGHHNSRRPHRASQQNPPAGRAYPPAKLAGMRVLRRDRLGGLVHGYAQVA